MSISKQARRQLYRQAVAVWLTLWLALAVWPVWASVDLTSFRAESNGLIITLIWETQSELDNLGFNVYRASRETALFSDLAPGEKTLVNNQGIIPSKGGVDAHRYEQPDAGVTPGVIYYYWLEDLDNHGGFGHHGPVRAEVTSGAPVLLPTVTTPAPTPTPAPVTPTATPVPATSTPRPADITPTPTVAPTATDRAEAAPTNTPQLPAPVAATEAVSQTAPPDAPTSEVVTPTVASAPVIDANQPSASAETQTETGDDNQLADVAQIVTPGVIGTDVAGGTKAGETLAAPADDGLTTPSRGVLIAIGSLGLAALTIGGAAVFYLLRNRRTE